MKKSPRRSLALFLVVVLVSSLLTVPAAASEAMGEEIVSTQIPLHQTVNLSGGVFWSTAYNGPRRENYITYSPGSAVTPMITYGDWLTARSTVSTQAALLEQQGYRVVAGINGDYYNTSTGLPIGLVVENGELKSSDAGYYAVGFRSDGSAVLGRPSVQVSADLGYSTVDADGYAARVVRKLAGINKARVSAGGIYLYTYDFNDRRTTGTTEPGIDVVCRIVDGKPAIGSTVTLQVEQVLTNVSATRIRPDQVVLSVNYLSDSYYVSALAGVPVGATISVTAAAADPQWNDVEYAVGALHSLLENGVVNVDLPNGLNPRTAVGQKADGTVIFYTMDGRQSGHSIGCSLTQVAKRLAELGCITAVCLDGGGSTTLAVTRPGDTTAQILNRPSDGSERSVSNQIFLVAKNTPSGIFSHVHLDADNHYVLAGSQVGLTAAAVDTHYLPMDMTVSVGISAGSLLSGSDGSHTLVTPSTGGTVTVSAVAGGQQAALSVHAVTSPDTISVKHGSASVSSLTLAPDDSLQLSAAAVYNHLPLLSDADAFTWALDGGIGTVSETGLLTAGKPGSGTLTVSAGSCSASIPVTVKSLPLQTLQDFEGLSSVSHTGLGASMKLVAVSDQVKLGRSSALVNYTLGVSGSAALLFAEPWALPGGMYHRVNLWVRGDGSGSLLSLATDGADGMIATPLTVLNNTDWQLISVELPADARYITGISITGSSELPGAEEGIAMPAVSSGHFFLDQLTATYGDTVDSDAPSVSAALSAADGIYSLTASVLDDTDGILPAASVSVTLDGKEIAFTYDEKNGTLTSSVTPEDLWGHRFSVFARDASGNLGRASCDIPSSAGDAVFSDIGGYWAADYVAWLKTTGITMGYADGTFRPNQSITRQQFVSMLFNYLGLNAADYENVALPFADADQIAAYAQPAVKALYTMGVIGGTVRDGGLYFLPGGNLTRAQAAAMIGRTQAKGFASAPLDFSDTAAIPAYTAEHIASMVTQGVLGGYGDGSFRPGQSITRGQMAKILYHLL